MHVHMCTGMRLGTGTCTGTGTGTCTDLDTGTGTGTGTGTVRATSMHMHEHACMRSHGTRVRAHVCGQLQRAVHPHHTHTHMCTQRDAHVHAHAREHPAHLHTELTRQLIKDTAHAASFAALPARARACQLALPKTLRLWDHAQLSCSQGPKGLGLGQFNSQGLDPGSTGRLMRNAKFVKICGKNSPHRPFSAYLSRCAIACVLRKLQLHRYTDVSCRRHDYIALPDVRCVVTAGLDGGASLRLLCLLLDTMELFLLKLVFPVVQLRACAAQASVSS